MSQSKKLTPVAHSGLLSTPLRSVNLNWQRFLVPWLALTRHDERSLLQELLRSKTIIVLHESGLFSVCVPTTCVFIRGDGMEVCPQAVLTAPEALSLCHGVTETWAVVHSPR